MRFKRVFALGAFAALWVMSAPATAVPTVLNACIDTSTTPATIGIFGLSASTCSPIGTMDKTSGAFLPNPVPATDCTFLQSGTGTITRGCNAKLAERRISIADFKQAGDSDDTPSFTRGCTYVNSLSTASGTPYSSWQYPVLFVPSGNTYNVSSTITACRLVSDGRVRIVMSDSTKDVFYVDWAVLNISHFDADNVALVGGLHAWHFTNSGVDIDNSLINLTKNEFYSQAQHSILIDGNANSVALTCTSCNWMGTNGAIDTVGDVTNVVGGWGEPIYTNYSVDRAFFKMSRSNAYSQMLNISDFTGVPALLAAPSGALCNGCYKATAGQTDFVPQAGFPIVATYDFIVYKNGALMTYSASPADNAHYSVLGLGTSDVKVRFGAGLSTGDTVVVNTIINQARWVDNRGSTRIHRTRFGGEFGGIACVYNWSIPATTSASGPFTNLDALGTFTGGEIEIVDSWTQCGPAAWQTAGVVVVAGQLPTVLHLAGNRGPNGVPVVQNVGPLGIVSISSYFASYAAAMGGTVDETQYFRWNIDQGGARLGSTPLLPSGTEYLVGKPSRIQAARAFAAASHPLSAGPQTVALTVGAYDTGQLYSSSSGGFVIKAPGNYHVDCNGYATPNTAANQLFYLQLLQNSTAVSTGSTVISTAAAQILGSALSDTIALNKGDVIKALAFSTGTNTLQQLSCSIAGPLT